ncbi:peptidoglycan -binding protein [Maritimibacter sp. DP1N21-5]|uniref:peptidoglycan -binding protein n=1 Tax=Maritimibacter sp. DP1N21-5 TaxID=2836867 RepID=UPI001C470839|nr:peptidoglycan -binding protein [Maritimibacter sp. DP1N21-5]MBV7410420.1 peptidoglycan -binding protein [Maritimibacter sp. DP1N21-5]
MALARRSVRNVSGTIWPGFVDAMTALLLVLMFVLTIFMVVQFVLREQISGQATELDALSLQVADLADALGLERQTTANLREEVGSLTATLTGVRAENDAQVARIAELTAQSEAQAARIASFEDQVATLLAERDQAIAQGTQLAADIEDLEAARAQLIDEKEALQLALARAREEVDSEAEAARLAAARREAVEAMLAEMQAENTDLQARISDQQATIDDAEAARLADAAALEALRTRLENADDEITAMSLALEEQRKRAEETLTLLAAARASQEDLEAARDAALTEAERRAALLTTANEALSGEEAASAEAQRKVALLNEQVAALRTQLGNLQDVLDESEQKDEAAQVQIEALGSRLNTALAQVAAEQRRRAALEQAEAERLAAEAERLAAENLDLASYRSEFFGKLRQVLGDREGVRIEGDRFVFSSEVLFDVGAAEMSEEGQQQIAGVANILLDVAGDIPEGIDWILRVDGHTDSQPVRGGRWDDNWQLSQARALSVVRFMQDDLGFPPERLVAAGFGEFQPLMPGDSPEALAANRRIELKLTEK